VPRPRRRGNPSTQETYWNTTQVADYLRVNMGTVSSYRGRNQMPEPDVTVAGHIHLWRPATIVAWQENRRPSTVARWRRGRGEQA